HGRRDITSDRSVNCQGPALLGANAKRRWIMARAGNEAKQKRFPPANVNLLRHVLGSNWSMRDARHAGTKIIARSVPTRFVSAGSAKLAKIKIASFRKPDSPLAV